MLFSNELASAKEIIEISKNEIIYADRNYNLQKIYWTNDTLIIKNKPLNKPGFKISLQKIEFILLCCKLGLATEFGCD